MRTTSDWPSRATILRPFADSDQAAVRELFIAINRALAPADMKETFERYIETALAAEIDRLAASTAASAATASGLPIAARS